MKRLFAVKGPKGWIYFASKKEAKAIRNQIPGSVVRRGPDHRKGSTM
jgi:hypothetical protein